MYNSCTNPVQQVKSVDPYVTEALKCLIGTFVVIETTRGRIDGTILDVKPDHVLLQQYKTQVFVRISEIV